MRKHDEIMISLDTLSRKIGILEKLASDKAVKLEQALNRAESQRDTFKHQRDTIMDERDALRTENERLKREAHALGGRLRHLLQSKTIERFDERDHTGGYKYNIKDIDAVITCCTCRYENKDITSAPCKACGPFTEWVPKR
jgi:FtsZ-binding cell division protein ZapB